MIDKSGRMRKMSIMAHNKRTKTVRISSTLFGDKVNALIEAHELTKDVVGKEAKVAANKISKWKDTGDPGKTRPHVLFEEAWRLARHLSERLSVPVGDLLDYLGDDGRDVLNGPPQMTDEERAASAAAHGTAWQRALANAKTPVIAQREAKGPMPKKSSRRVAKRINLPR